MKKVITTIVVLAVITAGVFSLSSSSDDTGQEISLTNLLDLLYNYEGTGRKPDTPLQFICRDDVQEGDKHYAEVVYGHGVKKGDKKDVGYEITTSSPHAYFFCMSFDSSVTAGLYYVDKGDAERFLARIAQEKTVQFNGKTFNVITKPDDKRLYITNPWGDGNYETQFALYPITKEGDFYRIEIEVYD